MATAVCDGIETRYEVSGDGPPLLLFSPGGFDAKVENWTDFGIYRRLNLLEHLRAATRASPSTSASRAARAAASSGSAGTTTPRRGSRCSTTSGSSART